ncbi:unnamed protein product [Paramecium pentaurelia]|uniref:Insulin-degrading enzyme n=1 Tax=Paramecium pentaurelia TaxID=43138 RepID=A0A8S1S7T1_9CILI|nr:unnamed protein product [Paramecium pentaurelia]
MPQLFYQIQLSFVILILFAILPSFAQQHNTIQFGEAITLTNNQDLIELENEKQQRTIIKPLIDPKTYKYIELENKLKVLLIHDPNSEIASAALDVQVGSWNEPSEYPGLAHFCEHMLFVGSVKYPRPDYFDELLAKGSGSSNAYTDATNTNYYFEITSQYLDKALDTFAHFFIDPLFNEDLVEREKNAVNSEYEIDVSSEDWKIQNLFTLFADPKHPASRFSLGNNEVFEKQGIENELKSFFEQYYSSNIMSLVIQSRISLQEMEQLIKPFSRIKNKNLQSPQFPSLPYQFGILCKYKTEKEQLTLNWQLKGREKFIHQKPIEFLDYIIQNGNLIDYMKEQNLIISLSSQVFMEESSFTNYMMEIVLTEKSQENEEAVAEITKIIFNYIQKLEVWLSDDDYINQLFKEQSKISKLNFNYLTQQLDTSTIAKILNRQKPKEVLSSEFIIDTLDKELILNYIGQLKNTQNLIILIGNHQYSYTDEKADAIKSNKEFLQDKLLHEKNNLYRLVYSKQKFDEHFINFISKQDEKLQDIFEKPQQNEFIPDNVELISLCESSESKLPKIVHSDKLKTLDQQSKLNLFLMAGQDLHQYSDEQCSLEEHKYQKQNHYPILLNKEQQEWWKSQTSYKLPFIFGALQMKYQKTLSLRQFTSLRLYNFMANEILSKELKLPLSSGYSYELDMNKKTQIKVYGFSEHVRNLFKKLCSCLNPFRDKSKSFLELNESKRFEIAKQSLLLSIKNMYQDNLFEQAMQIYLPQILQKDSHNPTKVIDQINLITQQEMLQDVKDIMNNVKYSSLLIGNIDQSDASKISDEIQSCSTNKETSSAQDNLQEKVAIINLKGKHIIDSRFIQSGNDDDINGVTLNYYQIGQRKQMNQAFMKLLEPILNQQAYNYLRTDLQLGYVVAVEFKTTACVDGALILVQGSTEIPMKVNQIINDFLDQFSVYLEQMNNRGFQHLKHGVITELKENPQSLSEEGDRLWKYISAGTIEFEDRQVAIEEIRKISKQELIEFYKNSFINSKSKLSLQLYGQGMVTQMMNLETQSEFNEFISNTKPKDAELFDPLQASYYQCEFEATQI